MTIPTMSSSEFWQTIELNVEANDPSKRKNEPLTCGIPIPRGTLFDPQSLKLVQREVQIPLQTTILDTWQDGSIRWLLLDWQATYQGNSTFQIKRHTSQSQLAIQGIVTSQSNNQLRVDTGNGVFTLNSIRGNPILTYIKNNSPQQHPVIGNLSVLDEQRQLYHPIIRQIEIELSGLLRTVCSLRGHLVDSENRVLCDLTLRFHFYAGSSTTRTEITLTNSRKAEHPGGLWDLGNGGSIYLRDASLQISMSSNSGQWNGSISPEHGQTQHFTSHMELYQESSGGENWNSSNHVNRFGEVPLRFRGYQLYYDQISTQGLRATPSLVMHHEEKSLGLTVPEFWQRFPQAVEAKPGELTYRFIPRQTADVLELQGGEQITHCCYLAFDRDTVTETHLDWCRSPGHAAATPEWYASCQVVPCLTPRKDDPHTEYLTLVDAALDGTDTLQTKREAIDEYGWRHFGDIYGDHEAVFHQGPAPLISHYNNQYDAVAGLGYQYLRSADSRWLQEMRYLVRHVIDIDIYHTEQDKSAYNHGLFWHTFHYVDAHTGTHRSYPKDARVPPHGNPVPGGGPANEQNYAAGLMLHFFLTGDQASRRAALGLAQWVIDMDDGNKTVFRWLSRADTGLASKSRTPEYHGPGRGAANSISVLLDGHRLSRSQNFLDKAEQLIRRCIHPEDTIEKNQLLDAENRWFYTMFLQSLGKYLAYKHELNQIDKMYAYARASLLHYVRWMVLHEYPYLEKPDILEYPTETWAAQDMRKCEIFNHASLYCSDEKEAELFRNKADFFFRYSTSTLLSMPTRTLCRPVVLMLNFGFSHNWYRMNTTIKAPEPSGNHAFGKPLRFVPQKVIALKRAKLIAATVGFTFLILIAMVIYWLFRF